MRSDVDAALAPVLKVAATTAQQVDRTGSFPDDAVDALRASGLLGLTVPESAGGLGAGPQDFADVVYALSGACGSTAMVYLMHVAATMTVVAAPPTGHEDLTRRLADGRALGTLAFSERGSRSHFWSPVSRAETEQNTQPNTEPNTEPNTQPNRVRLRADKSWVTSAGHADVFVVSTLSLAGDGGIDLYAVPSGTAGLSVAGPWQGMGLRGNDSAPMSLDVTVTQADRIGEPGAGFGLMMGTVLPWFNLGNAAVSLGLAAGAVDAAVGHAGTARFEHLGQALADLPTIRARLARMTVQLAAHRAYLSHVATSMAQPDESTTLHVLGVKAAANDAALSITDEAMRVCGGAAFSAHLGVDRFFRDARAGHVMAPTADALYDFIGKAVTGRPLF